MTKNTLMTLALAAALATVSHAAFAAAPTNQPASKAECATYQAAHPELVGKIKGAAKSEADRRAVLSAELAGKPGLAVCILPMVKAEADTNLTKLTLKDLLALLANDPANEPVIKALLDANPELVAEIADDVEPAAGPQTTSNNNNSFSPPPGSGLPLENPNQISGN